MKKQLPAKKKEDLPAVIKKYTTADIDLVRQYFKKKETEPAPARFKADDDITKGVCIRPDELDATYHRAKMLRAFGTSSDETQNHFIDQLICNFDGCSSKANTEKIVKACNIAVAILDETRPRDVIEGMLITQMIAVHNMAMKTLGSGMLSGQDADRRAANVHLATKMLRTFTQQLETLKNYRQKGQQKVTVEHVNVNQGGQAIIGSVTREGGGVEKIS